MVVRVVRVLWCVVVRVVMYGDEDTMVCGGDVCCLL